MIKAISSFLRAIPLDADEDAYFYEQFLTHAKMSVKYALAAILLMLYIEWYVNDFAVLVIWGGVAILVQLGRYFVATRALTTTKSLLCRRLFFTVESFAGLWWVVFLFVMGWQEQSEAMTLWRITIPFIIMVFYMDSMRYSISALFIHPLVLCVGGMLYLYWFNDLLMPVKLNYMVMSLVGTAVLIHYGHASHLLSHETYQVIAQNKRLMLKMDDMLIHDELTKQHNRRYFDAQLSRYFSLFQRSGQHFCVAMVDVDYFKRINDLYGHAVGDAVLVALSAYIKDALRTSDIFARYGGEEFVILLPMTNSEESVVMLDRLRANVAAHVFKVDHLDIVLTISIGVAMVQGRPEELLEYADNALYQAKDGGRNQVVLFGG